MIDLPADYLDQATLPPMPTICIRYKSAGLDQTESNDLHEEVTQRVERSGRFWISTTEFNGKAWFRVNRVNFRARKQHDELFALLQSECRAVSRKKAAGRAND